jgi:hypothetical protein
MVIVAGLAVSSTHPSGAAAPWNLPEIGSWAIVNTIASP